MLRKKNLTYIELYLYKLLISYNCKNIQVFIAIKKDLFSKTIIAYKINFISHLYNIMLYITRIQIQINSQIKKN